MKVMLDQRLLLSSLKTVSRAVSGNNTLPVLGNILLRAQGGQLLFAATNLELSIQQHCDAAVQEEGAITVPAKMLTSYVSLLPDTNEIQLRTTDDNALEVTAGRSKTKIKGIAETEFPALPDVTGGQKITLSTQAYRQAVHEVAFAAQANASRPVLSGVLIRAEGTALRMVATDSYRLSEWQGTLNEDTPATSCLVPVRALQEADRIVQKNESITLQINDNQIAFHAGGAVLTSRLIEGAFPAYENIIPKEHKTRVTVQRGDLELAVRRLSLFAKQNNQHMQLDIQPDSLRVLSDATEIGQDETTLSAAVTGPSNLIALNADYLLEVLGALSGQDEIILELQEKMNPAVIKPKDRSGFLHLIMPLKV